MGEALGYGEIWEGGERARVRVSADWNEQWSGGAEK